MKNIIRTVAGIIVALLTVCMLFSCVDKETEDGASTRIETESEDITTEEATQPVNSVSEDTTPESEDERPEDLPGAETYDELVALLSDGYLFTEQKVNCMGQEFLFACLYTCDPENAAALFEERDCAEIASLLNDRFFSAIGEKPFKYSIESHTDYELSDEQREIVIDFFMNNRQSVVEQYGEYYFEKVNEENEGRQIYILLNYTIADEEGNETSFSEDADNALVFAVVNGRYYWSDFTLFSSIVDNK